MRRIVPYVESAQQVAMGQRVGMIRFGSQVDVLIPSPPGVRVVAEVGQELTAGESIIATYESS